MNLHPTVISLITAQNNQDNAAYVECFAETAIVHDEGKTHQGKAEIRQWNESTNREYVTALKPLNYQQTGSEGLLTAAVSGNFPGSPAVLQFHLQYADGLISALRITG